VSYVIVDMARRQSAEHGESKSSADGKSSPKEKDSNRKGERGQQWSDNLLENDRSRDINRDATKEKELFCF
jgi:hypothetical protein